MASVLIGGTSGVNILSGLQLWSGRIGPIGGIQLMWDPAASGKAYVGFSGGMTIASGGFVLSGGGLMDGMPMAPGGGYFIPKLVIPQSGVPAIYVACDATASGQARMYFEDF